MQSGTCPSFIKFLCWLAFGRRKRGQREGDGKQKNVTTISDKRQNNVRHVTAFATFYDNFRLFVPYDIKRHKSS